MLLHPTREEALKVAQAFVHGVAAHDIACVSFGNRLDELNDLVAPVTVQPIKPEDLADQVELVVVFGGDGTILQAAEAAVPAGVPLLGVNLGHVGFLAELDSYDVEKLVAHVAERRYDVEERLTLSISVTDAQSRQIWESIAINEVSLEKAAREKMLDVLVEIDRRPVSRWMCDGMLVSTPSGSTAYAFSVGGPVIWPDVQAFLVCPMAAHALFARPMVLDPNSLVDMHLSGDATAKAIVWCDGRRFAEIEPGCSIHVKRGSAQMKVARIQAQPFTSRLVKKFDLRIDGFRNTGAVPC